MKIAIGPQVQALYASGALSSIPSNSLFINGKRTALGDLPTPTSLLFLASYL